MISVIIPTLNAADTLADSLGSLIGAAVGGLVREVIVADGGSSDQTLRLADAVGADTVTAGASRASRLIAGAQRAKCPWLLFLEPDSVLDSGWERDAEQFIEKIESGRAARAAAVFRYAIDDAGIAPRAVEAMMRLGSAIFGLAHAEQGLLIQRSLYAEVGGHAALPILEDIDLARRIGRRRIVHLRRLATGSSQALRREGYGVSALRQAGVLALYGLNVPLERIAGLVPKSAVEAAGA